MLCSCSCFELNDLIDEILLLIFEKLDNLDILYSLHGVNKRLNNIIRDPLFTNSLNFVKWSSKKFSSNVIFNRYCLQILPDISMKIKWFYIESSSAKHILRAADYPNLYGLALYNMKVKTARRLFTGQCHVYSYPSEMQYYQNITNHFSSGLYKYVRLISLYDEHPFEHEFFIKISQSFPFLEIDISTVHEDYIQEFLFNTKTYFHNNIYLNINYKLLEKVTHNFARDDTN
ncbi:unnamed protein product [Rotaria sp. Silwood1]|nr:unnamed protein product [Rotaria sp. Silwood1]